MYQSSNKRNCQSLALENDFQKFKYNFHHWQRERLQNLSSSWIPRTAAHSKYPIYCLYTHKGCMCCPEYAQCLKQPGSSGYMDGWQEDHEAFHIAVTLMGAPGIIQAQPLRARLYLTTTEARTDCKKQAYYLEFFNFSQLYCITGKHFFHYLGLFIKKNKNLLNIYESCRNHLKIVSKMVKFQSAKTMTKELLIKTRLDSMLVYEYPFFQ